MSPEIQQLMQRIDTLERQMREFTSLPELAPDIKRTISQSISASSGKTAGSATQAVNESGTSTYNVMKAPDGFIRIGDVNVPYIN